MVPFIGAKTEGVLAVSQVEVPTESSNVAGTFKYNLPPVSKNLPAPNLSARAILVKDLTTQTVLYEKNSNASIPIASTTKIMTALVANSFFKANSTILVSSASAQIGGSTAGLSAGETLTYRSALYGMLLNSGNDAAYAIADNYPGGVPAFVTAMNQKAASLGLVNTHFDNPVGFDSPNHYSSASDLAVITEEALKDSTLDRVVATKATEIESLDKKFKHSLTNLNKLLSEIPGVVGVKTGYTEVAKENLVTLINRDNAKVLVVLLGSDDRFGETTTMINWVFNNYQWQQTQ